MRAKVDLQLILTGLFTLSLAGCGSHTEAQKAAPPEVRGVAVETVQFESTPEVYEAVGTVRSATTSALNAQISGTVREMFAKAGDRVRRGQLLAVLDGRMPKAQLGAATAGVQATQQGLTEVDRGLEAAKANRKFAEATYHRYQNLLAQQSVSRQEFDQAQTRYEAALASEEALAAKRKQVESTIRQAQAQQASAQTYFSFSRVVSPIDGVVTAKPVDTGTVVMPGTPLLTIEDPSHLRLEISVPEAFLGKVKQGELLTAHIGKNMIKGRVSEIVPAADPASRTFLVKVSLPAECQCPSGSYGKAEVPVGETNSLTVPSASIVERGELEGVFVADAQGIVRYRLVTRGKTFGDRVEILSGLNPGDRVAVSNVNHLSDGDRVLP
ncbi:MAG TPA: efflux RND transporter periplasmic adaptor subunit [Terriglobia bacterium]|nr:efflux RND transporter periplasmic adaptor subunit [Terriglobia bacterium]